MKVRQGIRRGKNIVGPGRSTHFSLLLEGTACTFTRDKEGVRHIHAFLYSGDFLGLQDFLHTGSQEIVEVEALSACTIGTVETALLDQAIGQYPDVGRALWRAALVEASIARQRLVMARRPALQRVAHVLSEQLTRLGPNAQTVPLTQIEIADAAGVSVVHINRIFQDLRALGLLTKAKRPIEVLNKSSLEELAGFDPSYLHAAERQWDLRIEDGHGTFQGGHHLGLS